MTTVSEVRQYSYVVLRWTQCQAQLWDQFSVWVPPVTLVNRLTMGLLAR